MAKYDVECEKCSESFEVQLYGKMSVREWKLETWTWICEDCKAKQRAEENAKAAEKNVADGLVELTGSEKQIAWAETIRAEKLDLVEDIINRNFDSFNEENKKKAMSLLDWVQNQERASWWINNRDYLIGFRDFLTLWREAEEKDKKQQEQKREQELKMEAEAEATVMPKEAITNLRAEVKIDGEFVEVRFPEKNDTLRQLVKSHGFSWHPVWKRKIDKFSGPIEDRAVEIGHLLLDAGFPIIIYDQELRERAIKGEYEPEITRWVAEKTTGQYAGWFSISWRRKKEDYYKQARRLDGSKWSSPSVVVPVESYKEVLDFAEIQDFTLSPGAKGLVEKAQEAEKNITVADVVKKLAPKKKSRKKIEVPTNVEIDNDLKD